MKITAYNQHDVGSSHEPWSCFIAYQSTRDGPTSLCNQAQHERSEDGHAESRDPCLPTPSSSPKRSSLCELRPVAFLVRTPLYAGRQRKGTRDLSTPRRDSQANPFTPLKMTRGKGQRKAQTFSARSSKRASASPKSTRTTNNNPNTNSSK